MSLTLSNMATRVLRNVQIPEDSTTTSVAALAAAKQYINEAHHDVWSQRVFRESLATATYSVPAATVLMSLSAPTLDTGYTTAGSGVDDTIEEIIWIREGTKPYSPQDIATLNVMNVATLTNTNSPLGFTNRGASGILLHGQFTTATTLSFLVKLNSQDLGDSETWILDTQGSALIAKATGDMIRDFQRDDNRAAIRYQEYAACVQALIDKQMVQGANTSRIVPVSPFTGYGSEAILNEQTRTGFSTIYP